MNFARSFIVLAFTLSSFSLSRADISSADVQEILTILNHSLWNNDPTISPSIPTSLEEITDFQESFGAYLTGGTDIDSGFNYRNRDALPFHLQALIYGITGWNPQSNTGFDWSLHGDLQSLLAAVSNLNASGSSTHTTNVFNVSVQPTNIINLSAPISPDVLAGNPWWATNSAFTQFYSAYSSVYPDDGKNVSALLSFPQLMSRLAMGLYRPAQSSISADWDFSSEWGRKFVANRFPSQQGTRAYSWFDWVTDAFRSNWVASASQNADLITELRALSNALASASASVNVTNQTYVFLTNLVSLSADDILAGNPWWATNSNFAFDWLWWNPYVTPWPTDAYPGSFSSRTFPEAFSLFLSSRTRAVSSDYRPKDFWQTFGGTTNSYNVTSMNLYTFEDWVADAFNSNLVLQVAPTYASLTNEVAHAYAGEDDYPPTNSVLPAYTDLISEGDTSAASSSLQSGASTFEEQLTALSGLVGTQGDDEIVLIPEMTVGGIHVDEYRAHLATSITPVCRRIMQFIWAVSLFAALFSLAQSEWAFYANLGRTWTTSGGFHERDGP